MRLDGEWGEGDIFQKKELRGFVYQLSIGGQGWKEERLQELPLEWGKDGGRKPGWEAPAGRHPGDCNLPGSGCCPRAGALGAAGGGQQGVF